MRSIGLSGFLKRALPFFATFAVALFITSFFVDLRGSRYNFRARGWERHKMMERMRIENEQLKAENEELKRQIREGIVSFDPVHHPGDKLRIVELPVESAPPPARR